MPTDQPVIPKPKLRWLHLTPGRLLVVLLAVEGGLLLSERFQWFAFNEKKGWAVLIATAAVGLFLLLMLLWLIMSLIFHWRFQFSIRSLLVLTVAVAIPFSWLAMEKQQASRQKEITEAILKSGGFVGFDYQHDTQGNYLPGAEPPGPRWLRTWIGDDFFSTVVGLNAKDISDKDLEHFIMFTKLESLKLKVITDTGLAHLKGLTHLRFLNMDNTEITDAGLAQLEGLTQLRTLELRSTKITDTGLMHLKGLAQLQSLDLSNTAITDAGLEHLKGLAQLQELDLRQSKVTDSGLVQINKLPHLRQISLGSKDITVAGIEHLKEMTQFRKLILEDTNITSAQLKNFRSELPDLQIYFTPRQKN